MQRPTQYVLPPKSITRMILIASFFPLVIAVAVFAGVYVTNQAVLEEWKLPLIGIGGASLAAFIGGSLFSGLTNAWERRAIRRVYDTAWADWSQYTSEEKWHKFIESEHKEAMDNIEFSIIPIIIVSVVVGIIALMSYTQTGEILLLFGLGGFMLIVIGALVFDWWSKKADIRARYKRRMKMQPPHTLISRGGHYDEDKGYSTFRGLKAIQYEERGKTKPAKITFTIRRPWWEELLYDSEVDGYANVRQWDVVVNVPKGYEDEAQALVERFRTEVLR